MNIKSPSRRNPGRFFGKLLSASLSVWLLGVAFTPALAATVPVDQQPLIIQKPLPPNIVLMLDDSGSMAWDVMPDWEYLNSTTADALVSSDVNGVYYNPTETYNPPPKADGTAYPNADFANALVDGFDSSSTAVDLSRYLGTYDASESGATNSRVRYSAAVPAVGGAPYNPNKCSDSGDRESGTYTGYCYASSAYGRDYDFKINGYYYFYRCASADAFSGTQSSGKCYPGRWFFTYATRNTGGTYTRHYVAKATGDCATAGLSAAVCNETATARQNVANWFSYYHTRMLMAKSGLMDAFVSIDPSFRVGFGSINGNNDNGLPSPKAKYGSNNNYIAQVVPFGDGASGTQKANFWSWVNDGRPSNSTPLRRSLDAVGRYYKTAQPWTTMSSDSVPSNTPELACRQSYTILTTDGFWNGGTPNVGEVDNVNGTQIQGPNGQSYTYIAASPYLGSTSNTLADVAMKYWMTDLRPTDNEVPTSTEDPAFWQHMTTFTLGLGFTPVNISPSGTTVDQIFSWANGGSAIKNFSWPAPSSDSINNIADMAHAAVNGHGGFYSATTPDAFASGLKDALKRAAERVGTGASLAANSTQLKTGTFAYQANYYTAKWKGDLKAISVDPNTGALATTPSWNAASKLPAFGSRKIYTYNASASPAAVTFSVPSSLSAGQKSALGSDTTAQQAMINYLRGDATNEQKNGGTFRNRDTPLGDIVDSQPIYIGAPDANQFVGSTFAGSSSYITFASNQASSRTPQVLVAANDGMLHMFNADTGVETFAYLPGAVITNGLKTLADPDYGTTLTVPHQYFNDGELTVADVYFGSAWHTVAVGTTGRGSAQAIYALDVTDPTTFKLLWERSAGDGLSGSGYIGQMTGKPVIAQTADGNWSVLMGNGYNSAQGRAALLDFAITDGTLSVHTTTDTSTGNGLAGPAVWIGSLVDGISTVAYAGDRLGQVWSFVLNDGSTATPTSSGTLLFTAKDASNNVQPITGGMIAGKDPDTGNLWVFFGTGQYLSTADLVTTGTQSWYGLIVQSGTTGLAVDSSKGLSDLVKRSIVAETPGTPAVVDPDTGLVTTPAIAPARAVTQAPTTSDMSGKSGWYMNLLSPSSTTDPDTGVVTYTPNAVAQGERMVTPNQFQGNQLIATTRIPQAVDICNPSGRGWIMAVDPFTGTSPKSSFFDLNGDGLINQPADWITVGGQQVPASGIGFNSLPNNPIFVGSTMLVSFDNGSTGSVKTSGSGGIMQRVSWRELIAQ